jgi:hypothetical protein
MRARPLAVLLAVLLAAGCAALLPARAALAQPSASNRAFQEADLNRDGFVDLAEFQKDVVRGFHAIDRDRDGYLDLDELRALRVNTRSADRLAQAMLRAHDADGDARLSFREVVVGRMAYFEEADADRDDRLSASEAQAYDARMRERAREERAARRARRAEQGDTRP